jgi:hypothetical protein
MPISTSSHSIELSPRRKPQPNPTAYPHPTSQLVHVVAGVRHPARAIPPLRTKFPSLADTWRWISLRRQRVRERDALVGYFGFRNGGPRGVPRGIHFRRAAWRAELHNGTVYTRRETRCRRRLNMGGRVLDLGGLVGGGSLVNVNCAGALMYNGSCCTFPYKYQRKQ